MAHLTRRAGLGAILVLFWACDDDHRMTWSAPDPIVGSGVIASESRPASGFAALTVSGPLRVVLRQTGSESLVVTADDNVIPRVRSEVREGRLFLGFEPNTSLMRTREVACVVTTGPLREVEASGAARVQVDDVASPALTVRLSGATTGLGTGTVGQFTLDVSGASRWTGGDLRSRTVTAAVSGASYGLVRASDSLAATVSGVSVLEYVGRPVVVSSVDGLSVLRHIGP
jgi:hypothetical protein